MWYSHKHKKAGLMYELGISIFNNKLIWINGPFPAGNTDLVIYHKDVGLKSMIPAGKKVIADEGYRVEAQITTRNRVDSTAVKEFKGWVTARQETFNKRLKDFKILAKGFCHGVAKHQMVFEAVCVLVQYKLETAIHYSMFDDETDTI
jgi:hypothetical protein